MRTFRRLVTAASLAALLSIAPCAQAQWFKIPTPNAPRTADGKVNLTAPAPHLPDGKMDLSGIWEPTGFRYLTSLDSDGIQIEFQPWALIAFLRSQANKGRDDPDANCTFPGVPRIDAVPGPVKIVQNPGLITFLYEAFTTYRQIHTDGRALPKDPNPTWLGYSVGKWEGDTLVVDSLGFNDKTWLDNAAHVHSEALRVTERFHRRDFGHIDIQITIDDPKTYLRPWTVTEELHLVPDSELIEFVCVENNKDVGHLVGK